MRYLRRPIACVLFIWYLPACAWYRTSDLAPEEAVRGQEWVRVTVPGTVVDLKHPWVSDGTLNGTRCVKRTSYRGPTEECDTWSTPLGSVVKIETLNGSTEKTTAIVVLALAAAVGTVVLLNIESSDSEDSDPSCDESLTLAVICEVAEDAIDFK